MIIAALKSAFSPGNLIRTALAVGAVFLVAELLGFTSWILSPLASWKSRNG